MYFVFSTLQSDTVRCPDKNRNTQSTGSDTLSQDVKCHCLIFTLLSSVHFSSVAQLCPIFCDAMNYSMPGLPVHHQLLEFTQTHVHWVGDTIQPSHPLSSPSPPAFWPILVLLHVALHGMVHSPCLTNVTNKLSFKWQWSPDLLTLHI